MSFFFELGDGMMKYEQGRKVLAGYRKELGGGRARLPLRLHSRLVYIKPPGSGE